MEKRMNNNVSQRAEELFRNGEFYCAESVLLAVAESQGIESDLLPQIATGFCSGMARTGGFCGALSGAMMSLGLLNGRSQPGAPVEENYIAVQTLIAQFEDKFGSTNCQELTGCHLGTPEGQAKFRESGQRISVSCGAVKNSVHQPACQPPHKRC
jgi:C_GCAxxG_C_C family probable redox protein